MKRYLLYAVIAFLLVVLFFLYLPRTAKAFEALSPQTILSALLVI
jgi:hypothetical protein